MKHRSYYTRVLAVVIVFLFVMGSAVFGTLVINSQNRQGTIKNPEKLVSYYDNSTNISEFHGASYEIPKETLSSFVTSASVKNSSINADVLGSKSKNTQNKYIAVDLTNQKLYMYDNGKKVGSFLVSTGKWGLTPVGEFRIWIKLRYTLMTGGSKALSTYYYLPNVPYTMYFYNKSVPKTLGYGIHGAYWHNNFGHPMSHGCVNMSTEDAETLYNWASSEREGGLGTKIVIYGTTPQG